MEYCHCSPPLDLEDREDDTRVSRKTEYYFAAYNTPAVFNIDVLLPCFLQALNGLDQQDRTLVFCAHARSSVSRHWALWR